MILSYISFDIFNQNVFKDVAIIDSGFFGLSKNHILYNQNTFNRKHGGIVLQIASHHNPITFHLTTIQNHRNALLDALNALPDNLPILNLSLVWNTHNPQIYDVLFHKFKYIICAYKENTYPTLYKPSHPNQIITVSNNHISHADYIIPLNKVFGMSGISAITPIITNLISHNPDFLSLQSNLIHIKDAFIQNKNVNIYHNIKRIPCPNCGYVNDNLIQYCKICNHIMRCL